MIFRSYFIVFAVIFGHNGEFSVLYLHVNHPINSYIVCFAKDYISIV